MSDVISGKAAGAAHLTGYQLGVSDERARIIKLITTDGFEHCNKNLYNGGCDCRHIDDLLALIKGEQDA